MSQDNRFALRKNRLSTGVFLIWARVLVCMSVFIGMQSRLCSATEPAKAVLNLTTIPSNLSQLYASHPDCEFLTKLIEHYDVFLEIYKQCEGQFQRGCGSYLFDGKGYTYCEQMYQKQKLLYEAAKKSSRALEIGVYMGHSIFIMLLANPHLEITCIDIDDRFSKPALEVLRDRFNAQIDFFKNDSLIALPKIPGKFDLFHIDGYHTSQYLVTEFFACVQKRLQPQVTFIIDDYDAYPTTIEHLFTSNDHMQVLSRIIPDCSWRNILAEVLFVDR